MVKSMLQPGKQHNFRVTVDATWTDAFNRLADKHKWSANKTMNILLHNALNMMAQTNETITVDISPQELDTLLRLRQEPQAATLQSTPVFRSTPVASPVIETPTVEQNTSRPTTNPVAPITQKVRPEHQVVEEEPATPEKNGQKLSARERALAQSQRTKL